jgi:hypothetical protein
LLVAVLAVGAAAASSGDRSIRALLAFDKVLAPGSAPVLANPSVRILRAGRKAFAETVPRRVRGRPVRGVALFAGGRIPYFVLRDLDADGEPELVLTLSWAGGARCCVWSRIYRYDDRRRTYVAEDAVWGAYGSVPALRDLDGDGRWELVGRDDRFARSPTPVAVAVAPLRIWSYADPGLRVVTPAYPALVDRDALRLWELVTRARREGASIRPALAAWAADQLVLGRARAVDAALAGALARGELEPAPSDVPPREPRAWIRSLKRALAARGYRGR